jgi:hypothetical protein
MAVMLSARAPNRGLRRIAELRFGHPFAVVAVAIDQRRDREAGRRTGPWHGVPVFSAWVADPQDADEDEPAGG